MENIRRKCNLMVNLLKFTSNNIYIYIYIKWSCNLNLQPSLLPNSLKKKKKSLLTNFVQSLIMLGLKKFRVVIKFF